MQDLPNEIANDDEALPIKIANMSGSGAGATSLKREAKLQTKKMKRSARNRTKASYVSCVGEDGLEVLASDDEDFDKAIMAACEFSAVSGKEEEEEFKEESKISEALVPESNVAKESKGKAKAGKGAKATKAAGKGKK